MKKTKPEFEVMTHTQCVSDKIFDTLCDMDAKAIALLMFSWFGTAQFDATFLRYLEEVVQSQN